MLQVMGNTWEGRELADASALGHNDLYAMLRRLLRVTDVLVQSADANSADFYSHLDAARAVVRDAGLLLYPTTDDAPPAGVTVKYGRSVVDGDVVFIDNQWRVVLEVAVIEDQDQRPIAYLISYQGSSEYATRRLSPDAVVPVKVVE